jgi:hypothetical protein
MKHKIKNRNIISKDLSYTDAYKTTKVRQVASKKVELFPAPWHDDTGNVEMCMYQWTICKGHLRLIFLKSTKRDLSCKYVWHSQNTAVLWATIKLFICYHVTPIRRASPYPHHTWGYAKQLYVCSALWIATSTQCDNKNAKYTCIRGHVNSPERYAFFAIILLLTSNNSCTICL